MISIWLLLFLSRRLCGLSFLAHTSVDRFIAIRTRPTPHVAPDLTGSANDRGRWSSAPAFQVFGVGARQLSELVGQAPLRRHPRQDATRGLHAGEYAHSLFQGLTK